MLKMWMNPYIDPDVALTIADTEITNLRYQITILREALIAAKPKLSGLIWVQVEKALSTTKEKK